jgi:hypothetical protein
MAMYVLDSTTKTIKVAMSAAAATTNPDYTVAYADNNGTAFTEGATDGVLNGTADVTVCAAPAASTRRIVKAMTIHNRDTAAVTINIKYDNSGTQRRLTAVTLAPGETWTMDGSYDLYGNFKQSSSAGTTLTISGFSGNIYYQTATSMTISGLGFYNLITVRFSFSGTVVDVSVTPVNSTTINVSIPSTIYNLASSTSGTVTLIDSANRQSNSISTYVYTVPSGGMVTTSGNYKTHTFTSAGTFTTGSYAPTAGYEVLVVAGGGPGGGTQTGANVCGGGGAGGIAYFSNYTLLAASTAHAVTIGAGGSVGSAGGNSSLGSSIQAVGGGRGGGDSGTASGGPGGSGGGASYGTANSGGPTTQVSTFNYGYGNVGGTGGNSSYSTGGGGGAGVAGGNGGTNGAVSGSGGNGLQYSISGTPTYYAGGGGGGLWTVNNGINTPGGLGGGGQGGFNGTNGTDSAAPGTANTGGGGGGGHTHTASKSGGSGIVIVKYLLA